MSLASMLCVLAAFNVGFVAGGWLLPKLRKNADHYPLSSGRTEASGGFVPFHAADDCGAGETPSPTERTGPAIF